MTIPDPIQQAIQAYYAERATDEDIAALEAWFRADEANVRIFAEHGMVEWHMLCEQEKADAAAILTILREAEDHAAPALVTLAAADVVDRPIPKRPAKAPITLREFGSVAGYLAGQTLRTRAGLIGSIAAVLMLMAVLYVSVFGLGGTTSPQDVAQATPDAPAAVAKMVATLTAERGAVWDRRPGQDLYSGQRLTLTAGFAEITTARGAVAILQAPATIELLDHDNALRLHTGKLVGICQTESSKGFLVRTPHMVITDLGTVFGVDASSVRTQLQVFEGEVEAKRVGARSEDESIRLVSGQSAGASADTASLNTIQYDPQRFAALLPPVIQLPGTGQGLSVGEIDSIWQIVAIDGQKLDEPLSPLVTDAEAYVKSFPNDPATSQWLAWDTTDASTIDAPVIYHFQKEFDLPEDIDPANTRLRLRYMADNALAAVVVNGHRVEISNPIAAKQFDTWMDAVIDQHLVAGKNTIAFEVIDSPPTGSGNLVGLRLNWQLETIAYRLENTPRP